jgi:hypothetical protein
MLKTLVICSMASALLAGCASSQMKVRKEQRDKAAQNSKLYCDFVNGDLFPDVEVMLNLEMAKRCDSEKTFTITQYKTTNENMGIVYCCSLHEKELKEVKEAKTSIKPETKRPEAVKQPEVKKPAPPVAPTNDSDLGD